MSFGGFGLWEILLIFVIALIVFGPDKLPELARTLGKGLREITMLSHQFSQELNRQLQEPPEQEQPPKQQEPPQSDSRPAGVEGDGHKP
ncbi:MAG TPA: twin-arginine translocase TatA/TatE family subunit [Thermoleophilia bacterium]|nr:twin-arginine translocase TatA/TatE family subunit [Thermoleophilia bacterium]